jgi:hypothetical protein
LLARGKVRKEDEEPNIGAFSYYVEAYNELATCRTGMDVSPIPFTAIAEYARIYNVEDFEDFLSLIRRIDNFIMKKEKAKHGSRSN